MLYIIEAALEAFISIAVSSVYLAKIAEYIGVQDCLTAKLSAYVSLECGFQLIARFFANKRPVKNWVTYQHNIISKHAFSAVNAYEYRCENGGIIEKT